MSTLFLGRSSWGQGQAWAEGAALSAARPPATPPAPHASPFARLLGEWVGGSRRPEGLGVAGETAAVAAEPARLWAHGRPLRRAVSGMDSVSQQCIGSY